MTNNDHDAMSESFRLLRTKIDFLGNNNEGDSKVLTRVPGIGKKTAQRIALELKDKITQADVSSVSAGPSDVPGAVPSASGAVVEAIEALTALGYSSTEARNALAQIPDPPEKPEELIRLALRAMAGM